jgi:hypothetical protein
MTHLLAESVMITGFVTAMRLPIGCLNVVSRESEADGSRGRMARGNVGIPGRVYRRHVYAWPPCRLASCRRVCL